MESNDKIVIAAQKTPENVKENIVRLHYALNAQKERYESIIKRMKVEFNKTIAETKKKQWCAHCQKEANGKILLNFCSTFCSVDW